MSHVSLCVSTSIHQLRVGQQMNSALDYQKAALQLLHYALESVTHLLEM